MKDVAGGIYQARVGMIRDYDNIWDAQLDVWHGRLEKESQKAFFEAAQLTHTPFDYVYLDETTTAESLEKYRCCFIPRGDSYGRPGEDPGRLCGKRRYPGAGCRSGYKDITGKCVMEDLPGLLAPADRNGYPGVYGHCTGYGNGDHRLGWNPDGSQHLCGQLEAAGPDARIAGVYMDDYYSGSGALVENRYGKGRAYYYGSAYTPESVKIFLEKLGVASPYKDTVEAPETCEIAVREKDGRQFLFVLNYEKKPAAVKLLRKMRDLYTGEELLGTGTGSIRSSGGRNTVTISGQQRRKDELPRDIPEERIRKKYIRYKQCLKKVR